MIFKALFILLPMLSLSICSVAVADTLFSGKNIIPIKISTNFSQILNNKSFYRNNFAKGKLILGLQDPVVFDIKINTRGRSRMTCEFPPLKIKFKKEQIQQTIFEGNRKLKLYTHCGSILGEKTNRERVFREYKIYKRFNKYTKKSFKVRLLDITYIDTAEEFEQTRNLGFFIESTKHFEKRNNLEKVEVDPLTNRTLEQYFIFDRPQLRRIKRFNFIIGNQDWYFEKSNINIYKDHWAASNIKLFKDSKETLIPVPYDFDKARSVDKYHFNNIRSPELVESDSYFE